MLADSAQADVADTREAAEERDAADRTAQASADADASRAPEVTVVVDERAEMHRLLDAGVTGLVTDRAALLAEVLAERGQWPPPDDPLAGVRRPGRRARGGAR